MGQIAKTITAGRGVRVTALVNKDETHEGRLGRGRIRDLDREEKPASALKAMARNWDLILLAMRSRWGT